MPGRHAATRPANFAKALVLGFVLSAITAIWIVTIEQARLERSVALDAAVLQNKNRVLALEQYVRRTLEAADLVTLHVQEKYLANDLTLDKLEARKVPTLIFDRVVQNPSFAAVNVLNAHGRLIATTLRHVGPDLDFSDHPVFASAVNGRDSLQVSKPTESRLLHGKFIYLTRRYRTRSGAFGGVVGVMIRPSELTNIVRQATFNQTDLVSVIGLDGITRARRTGNLFSSGEDVRGGLVMRMQMRNPNGTYVGPSVLDGIVRFFSHRRIPEYSLFVTSGISRDAVLAPSVARARAYYLAAGLVSFIILLAYWLLIRSIDRQQKLMNEIEEANDELREAQRIGRIGNWRFDPTTGMVRWSYALNEMYGLGEAERLAPLADFAEYVGAAGHADFRSLLDEVVRSGERREFPLTVTLPGGAVSHRYIIAEPYLAPDGTVVFVRGTDQDISVSKKLEAAEARVAELSRLSSMNAMASTIAHELNQPLTAAANYLWVAKHTVERETSSVADLSSSIGTALDQVLHAGEIIKRVRAMVSDRQDSRKLEPLPAMVDDVMRLFHGDDARACRISADLNADVERVFVDRVHFKQVLTNLIRNAIEACDPNRIPEIRIKALLQADKLVKISVEDNGCGFPSHRDDPFSGFSSEKGEGLGLGLSISRSIVEADGGSMAIERTGEDGTVVSFTVCASAP